MGLAAAALVCAGVVIALGPALPRRLRTLRLLLRRMAFEPPPAPVDRRELVLPGLHPTSQRAVLRQNSASIGATFFFQRRCVIRCFLPGGVKVVCAP